MLLANNCLKGLAKFMDAEVFVRVENLSRKFGQILAVDSVDFSVEKGQVLGLVGPNGAGKTTTMRILSTFLSPSSGTAEVLGLDVRTHWRRIREGLGYLPESAPLYADMSVRGFLNFSAQVRRISAVDWKRSFERVVEVGALEDVLERKIERLSKGFRRRVALAHALIHDPPVLILDEPTDGLDPNQKFAMRTMIREMRAEKATIVSTHVLEEIEEMCDRVVVLSDGRVVANKTPAELRQMSKRRGVIRLELNSESARQQFTKQIEQHGCVAAVTVDRSGAVEVTPLPGADAVAAVVDVLRANSLSSDNLVVEAGRLDEVFRSLTSSQASNVSPSQKDGE